MFSSMYVFRKKNCALGEPQSTCGMSVRALIYVYMCPAEKGRTVLRVRRFQHELASSDPCLQRQKQLCECTFAMRMRVLIHV
jgi:hypothetical protein